VALQVVSHLLTAFGDCPVVPSFPPPPGTSQPHPANAKASLPKRGVEVGREHQIPTIMGQIAARQKPFESQVEPGGREPVQALLESPLEETTVRLTHE
jgi:hypothetical protein